MKTNITLFLVILFCTHANRLQAQKIQYFYFAPEATMHNTFGDAAKAFKRKDGQGNNYIELPEYRYVVVSSNNYDSFKSIASPNMLKTYDRLTTASQLKKKVDELMELSNRKVDVNVLLVDDRTGFSRTKFFCSDKDDADGKLFVWPCATNREKKNSPRYFGQVFFGERAAILDSRELGGFANWEGTIIHEFSHTQFLPDPEFGRNKWKSVGISYGGDKGHWFSELMADEQMALDEGLGSFFGLAHNPRAAAKLIDFANQNSYRFLLGSRSFLTGTKAMWNSPHKVITSGSVSKIPSWISLINTPKDGNYELRKYKWLDVPGRYVMYNEQMSQLYFYLLHQYAFDNKDRAYKRIILAAQDMARPNVHDRYPGYAANHIARNMELYASSVPGEADDDNGVLVSSMITYGLMDLVTHFGMTPDRFKKYLRKNQSGSALPIAYIKYWTHRDNLKELVCPLLGNPDCSSGNGPIDIMKAAEAIRDYFQDSDLILKDSF